MHHAEQERAGRPRSTPRLLASRVGHKRQLVGVVVQEASKHHGAVGWSAIRTHGCLHATSAADEHVTGDAHQLQILGVRQRGVALHGPRQGRTPAGCHSQQSVERSAQHSSCRLRARRGAADRSRSSSTSKFIHASFVRRLLHRAARRHGARGVMTTQPIAARHPPPARPACERSHRHAPAGAPTTATEAPPQAA